MENKVRAVLALLLLAGLAAAVFISNGVQLPRFRQQAQAVQQNGDDLTHWAERLAPVLPYLPATGVIGYISERDIPGLTFNATDQGEEFAMSQYVLAPRILEEGGGRALVVGNFGGLSPDEIPVVVAPLGLELERAFSYGIYLFRRAAP